jgi:phosphohistidine swiveling domain-containing protein
MSDYKETKQYIDISPHRSLMVKVGQTGYSLQEALAELIDNALDAKLEHEKLRVHIAINTDSIKIEDNGSGMSEAHARDAIRLGFSDKEGKLGEFGLGLKSATTFLGKSFTLTTTPHNHNNTSYQLHFNEADWLVNGEWAHYPFTTIEGGALSPGTTIEITGLKIDIDEASLDKTIYELGARFGPFITHEMMELTINDTPCKPLIPELLDGKHEVAIEHDGITVSGWWGYQLRGYDKNQFGFSTFRRGRLVTVFDKIGLNANQDIKQIVGELHIDGVDISHHKRSWQTGSDKYKTLTRILRDYFAPLERRPRRILSGYPVSGGLVEGKVKVVSMLMASDLKTQTEAFQRGDILVTEMTRPQYLLLIRRAAAIITDLGGTLCHAAVVAREFDIPGIVGTTHATSVLKDGQNVIIDGTQGIIYEV